MVRASTLPTTPGTECNFEPQDWEDGQPWGIDGPIIVCNTHGAPAGGEVYETGTGLCAPEHDWLRQHPPSLDGTCECGRKPCGFAIENAQRFPDRVTAG